MYHTHRGWLEREAPLDRCPLAACRRSGRCHHEAGLTPCRRTHETRDAVYHALADKLDRFAAEMNAKYPGRQRYPEGSYEQQRNLKILYDALRAADEASTAAGLAGLKTRSSTPAASPPATPAPARRGRSRRKPGT